MLKIAIIQFPGLNTEYETRREIKRAGMLGEFVRWNEPPQKLDKYDGFVIGGGFSYEDRGRAGIIAALDPIMKKITEQAEKGKPVLGICNGAQILLESGLIPGADGLKLSMALARNKRMKDGRVLRTGYYNSWVHLKATTSKESCLFTWNIPENEVLAAPIAHGEGRFTTEIPGLIQKLQEKGQIAFRYCDKSGVIMDEFPVNPNGAVFNIAALTNPAGNVLAIMPHLERSLESSLKLFTSMRDGLMARKTGDIKKRVHHLNVKPLPVWPIPQFQPLPKSLQLFVSLIITDNEAETFELTLKELGFPQAKISRMTHIELGVHGKFDSEKLLKKLIQSGVLLNTNKESVKTTLSKTPNAPGIITRSLLVREQQDFVGMAKLQTIRERLKFPEITDVRIGTLWNIHIPTKSAKVAEDNLKRMMQTHLFFNPHRQTAQFYGNL